MKNILFIVVVCLSTTFFFSQNNVERRTEFRDGVEWQYYQNEDIKISMTHSVTRSYGKWHQVDIFIANLSDNEININPEVDITSHSFDKLNQISSNLTVWSSDQYLKKVKRSQNWALALNAAAEGFNSGSAGYSQSSSYSATGGFTTSTTYNQAQSYHAQMAAQSRIAQLGDSMKRDQEVKKMGYLKRNTIYPGEAIQGYVNIERVKGSEVYVTIRINDVDYLFDWNFEKKKK